MMIRAASVLLAFIFCAVAVDSADAAQRKCDMSSIRKVTPKDAVIDSVKPIAMPVAHCEVLGHIITQNPGPNRVEFSVMLPDYDFNGRFYFVGEGGSAGFVPTTTLDNPMNTGYVNSTLKLLSEGFVVAGTDTGHKGSRWDFLINNPAGALDFQHRGAHVSTVAAQAIARGYYKMGGEKLYRYHLGCSGGGRMGARAIYHHPEDYDGVVASTGFGGGDSIWFPWILQPVINNPDSWISPAKLAFLERTVSKACGGPDGLVRDPKSCGFDVAKLRCKGADKDDCLTAAQIGLVKRITGPYPYGVNKTSGGFTLTNPTGWSSFLIGNTRPTSKDVENPWAPGTAPASYGISQSIMRGQYFNDPKFNLITDLDFNNPAHLAVFEKFHADYGGIDPELEGYKKAGGKLIMWAPLGENAVPPPTEIEYYEALKAKDSGTDDFVRLYISPGNWHCGGGTGAQDSPERFLEKVIEWAEEGKRPDAIVATGVTPRATPPVPGAPPAPLVAPTPARTVLLCPYPQTAVFKGKKGAFPYDASKWACEMAQ